MKDQKSLWVQGWIGINHSYAMVNQYQLLALAQIPDFRLSYTELPMFDPRWSKATLAAGFSPQERSVLESFTEHGSELADAIYRIHTPNTLDIAANQVMTFMVTEFGLDDRWFVSGIDVPAAISRYCSAGNLVITPSLWSRDRIVEFGFPTDCIYVVPHGVDTRRFTPMNPGERLACRAALGFAAEDVVFLNVGAPMWNKGMDLLFEAFFKVRKKYKNAKLLVKDQQALYGYSAVSMIQSLVASGRVALDADDIAAVRLIPNTLTLEQLRGLYGVADAYVSPYRAEGFNLPVIEAIACGTPVIVTAGGATDDFCNDKVSIKIPSTVHYNSQIQGHNIGAHLEPDSKALVEVMGKVAQDGGAVRADFAFGRADVLQTFSWQRAAALIHALI